MRFSTRTKGLMVFVGGLQNPEGPVALADGSWLIVEGGAEWGCVTHLSPEGVRREIKKTGRPNGLALGADGLIWVAESKFPALLRLTMDGHSEEVATGCDSEPFMFQNDLCFGPDGAIYITDSGVEVAAFCPNNQVRADYIDLDYDGRVYRIDRFERGRDASRPGDQIQQRHRLRCGRGALCQRDADGKYLSPCVGRWRRFNRARALWKRDPAGCGAGMERAGRDGLRRQRPFLSCGLRAGRCDGAGPGWAGGAAAADTGNAAHPCRFRAAGPASHSRNGIREGADGDVRRVFGRSAALGRAQPGHSRGGA